MVKLRIRKYEWLIDFKKYDKYYDFEFDDFVRPLFMIQWFFKEFIKDFQISNLLIILLCFTLGPLAVAGGLIIDGLLFIPKILWSIHWK